MAITSVEDKDDRTKKKQAIICVGNQHLKTIIFYGIVFCGQNNDSYRFPVNPSGQMSDDDIIVYGQNIVVLIEPV